MIHYTNTKNPVDFPVVTSTAFRMWVQNIWHENCREHEAYGLETLPMSVYWRQYKWWLKREYRQGLKRD